MQKYLPWLLRLIGPVLLTLFLLNSNLQQLAAILWHAHPWPIALSLLLMPPFLIIKAWRWQRIMQELEIEPPPLCTATNLYTVGVYLGAVTPGQAGDLVKAWYLRDRGQPLAPALLSVVLDRLCDLIVMVIFATFGILALGQLLPNPALQTALVIAMGLGLAALTTVLVARGPRQWMLTRILPAILPQKLQESLQRWNQQLATLAVRPRLLLPVGIASLLSASFTFVRLWLLFVALNIHLPLWVIVGVSALIAILQILPISIAGVGVRDAALLAVILPYGYTTEQALSLSALFLLLNIEHVLAGFLISFWYPIGKAISQPQPPPADQSVP
jgi:glycosyltransferase 2 family protein